MEDVDKWTKLKLVGVELYEIFSKDRNLDEIYMVSGIEFSGLLQNSMVTKYNGSHLLMSGGYNSRNITNLTTKEHVGPNTKAYNK